MFELNLVPCNRIPRCDEYNPDPLGGAFGTCLHPGWMRGPVGSGPLAFLREKDSPLRVRMGGHPLRRA